MDRNVIIAAVVGALALALFNVDSGTYKNPDEVRQALENYAATHGKYLYAPEGADFLGKKLPPGMRVNEYQSPEGNGFEIIYVEGDTEYSIGFGPQADQRTWMRKIPQPVASSTP